MKLNFGVGNDYRNGWDNVDIQKGDGINKSFDFDEFPYPLKKDTYDYVLMDSVLEHVQHPDKVLNELWKFCKKGAIIYIEVPFYNNRGAVKDMCHTTFFTDDTFRYFVDCNYIVNQKKKFKIVQNELILTPVGKWIGTWISDKLSRFFGGLIAEVHVKLKVLK